MTTKPAKKPTKKPKRKLGLNNHERQLYVRLVSPVRELVCSSPVRTDNYGARPRIQIVWTDSFPKPFGFPVGRIVSEVAGKRTLEYSADKVLNWLHSVNLTRDCTKSIYAARSAALISLTKIEQSIFNIDQKLLDEIMKMPQNRGSSDDNEQGENYAAQGNEI